MWGAIAPPPPAGPTPQPPAPAPSLPPAPPPGPMWAGGSAPPPPVKPGGIPGCLKVAIILVVILVIGLVAIVALAGTLISNLAGNLGGDGNGGAGIDAECAFLSDADARTLFGGNADAIELSGLTDAAIGFVIDKRVLSTAPDCWVTDGDKAYIARVALYQGNDAASVFEKERQAAQPTSEDQGGGISVTTQGYNAGEVSGLGDEAFCTGVLPTGMAGVLVRQGDRVVYASVGPANENEPPQMGLSDGGVVTAPELCTFAQEVASFILR
jgi:hypothetical protein